MKRLDLTGEVCPYTFIRSKLALEEMAVGDCLEITVDHPPAADNVPRSLRAHGHEVMAVAADGGRWRIEVKKRVREPGDA